MSFPSNFIWGAASAAAQVEGAWNEDGRTPSIWDIAGDHIKNGDTCHEGCDHYHHFREDVALMKKLGLKSYRFSISWSRIIPQKGKVNPLGIAFYRNLIQELRSADILPVITLFHWDLPVWVYEQGGWKSESVISEYLEYVRTVVNEFKDDVSWWITFNEPQIFITLGYYAGTSAPFETLGSDVVIPIKNMLLCHGKAVSLIREICGNSCQIGIAVATSTYIPDSETPEGLALARHRTFETEGGERFNSIYLDPICLGKATPMMADVLSSEDLEIISQPLDYIGVNVYQGCNEEYPDSVNYPSPNTPRTMMNWVIDSRCLYWTLRFYWERYKTPLMITENGMASPDAVASDGKVHDPERIQFITSFLQSTLKAVDDGIPVLGYLYWAIMDNFEWCEGYGPRFGIVHVNYETKERTPKDSAWYYSKLIQENGQSLEI